MRAGCAQVIRADSAVDADDEPEAAAAADFTPLRASSTAALRAGSTPSIRAPSRKTSGAGLDAWSSRSAMTPSITTGKRSRMPATWSTSSAFFELDTTAIGVPAACRTSSSAIEPGYGWIPSARSTREKTAFLRLPMPQTVSASGGSDGSPHGTSTSRLRSRLATPS